MGPKWSQKSTVAIYPPPLSTKVATDYRTVFLPAALFYLVKFIQMVDGDLLGNTNDDIEEAKGDVIPLVNHSKVEGPVMKYQCTNKNNSYNLTTIQSYCSRVITKGIHSLLTASKH